MKKLKDILFGTSIVSVVGTTDQQISTLTFDSRTVELDSCFIAIKGLQVDGHQFIDKAIDLGASAIICEVVPQPREGVTYIQVANSSAALAVMASNYYDQPSRDLKLIGITGTNGKTTIASLLYELFTGAGFGVGLLSTIKVMVGMKEFKSTHTTADSITINKYLRAMCDAGMEFCFMEVSSHGIDQSRTDGLAFYGGVFTNLTHDHLDYHKSFAQYRDVKKRFFDQLGAKAFALTNIDDKNGSLMLQNTKAKTYTYALKSFADYNAKQLEHHLGGQLLKIQGKEVWTKLIGSFNAYNILAIYAVSELLGMDELELLQGISKLESVSGRFEYMVSKSNITAIVDYAHTPDALENVLDTIGEIRTKNEQLITVVGCGGDRDKEKRPLMGALAAAKSDIAIFTNDNPRSEDPELILEAMEAGVSAEHTRKVLVIADRKQAIKTAVQMAKSNDMILVAGKGHETYQEINGERHPFDDFKLLSEFLNPLK
ncbi:MAG: UDP-N-acetylmuramoyl-L-alanyl-D-glutamate--2,6-diaminopimelate ligase [Flavobacteriaceae bacterium]|nr:UDP-N-acetylmuramoyl-L-alanyl-D-glutamate--2,6-diaminopimelate ligase [Flavobacteriaceae bacterium]NVJ72203.1 UDP-N-acetylmuramoyl-L-alanyl-D-glutamate--2,6-diaminopimelate ligase [Flavobacteriaceae bacterium]